MCGAVGLGSVIIVLLLPVYYRATTTFLAASPDQAKPELLFGEGNMRSEYYGNANDIDRLMTIANSNELIEFLIDSFDLYKVYDIDPTHPRAPFLAKREFHSLYEIEKTKRDAIEIIIEDRDKQRAADIANTAREKINELALALIKEGQAKAINTFNSDIASKQEFLKVLGDSLAEIRKTYSIYNIDAQSENLTSQYTEAEAKLVRNRSKLEVLKDTPGIPRDTLSMIKALVTGLEEEVKVLDKKIASFNDGLGVFEALQKQFVEAANKLGDDQERLKKYKTVYEADIPAIYLVEKAIVPVVKSRPNRKLIVVGAVLCAFLFGLIGILLFENYKDINWREVYHGK